MIINEEQYGISTGQRADLTAPQPKISPSFWGDTVPAAFRLENPVASMAVQEATSHPSELYDAEYDAYSDLGEYEGTREAMELIEAKNPNEMLLMKKDLARQKQDERIINDAGGLGTLASVMAGVASPTTLIPGYNLVKGGRAVSIAGGALRGSASAGGAIAIDEALLQQSQVARSPVTTTLSVGGGVILGGVMGGGVSAISRKQFSDAATKLERDVVEPPAIQPSKELSQYMKSVGAAMVDKPTLSDLTISGAAALTVSRASRFVNPFNRLANSPFTTSRETLLRGFETTLEFNLHRDGKTLGPAAETQIKLFDKYNAISIMAYKENFKAFKAAESNYNLGRKISGKEFRERLSRALRNGDVDQEIQEVTRAAQRLRAEVLDPIKDQAIEAGLLPKDITPSFAKSYLHRMWDRQKLMAYADEAKVMLRKWAEAKVDGEAKRLRAIIADAETQLAKISSTKRDAYADAFKKIEQEYSAASAAQKEIATRLANLREQIAKNNAAINKLKEAKQTPDVKSKLKTLRGNKQKLSALKKESVAKKKSNATLKSSISSRKAKIETEFREARVKVLAPDEMLQNTKALEERIYKTRLELDGILDPDGKGFKQVAEQTADEVYAKLTGIGSDTVPGYISPLTRGPLKEKLLDISDNDAEMFLKNDAVEVLNSYVHKMGSDIALTRVFGRADMKDQLDALAKEFQEALGKAKTPAERRKLEKAYRSDKSDLEAMRDLLRGHFNKHDPDSVIAQGGIALRDLTYMTSMGGVAISSIPDIARHTMVNGINRSFGDLLDNINLAPELRKMRVEDLKESGFLLERVLSSRLMTLADVNDPLARGSMLTRFTGSMSQGFSKLTLINHWNDIQKAYAATITQNRILRAVSGDDSAAFIQAKKQISAPEVELGKIRLYRGLEQPFDKNYNSSLSDAPQGYSTWTDNPDLAREYAGKNGLVYYTDLPKNKLGKELIDQDGERALFVDNEKPAGLRGIKGKEFLLYTEHDDYRAQNIKEFLDNSEKSLNARVPKDLGLENIKQSIAQALDGQIISKYTNDELLGDGFDIVSGAETLQIAVKETPSEIVLTNIATKKTADLAEVQKGTGKGKQVVEQLTQMARDTGKQFKVVGVTKPAEGFYVKQGLLKESDVEGQGATFVADSVKLPTAAERQATIAKHNADTIDPATDISYLRFLGIDEAQQDIIRAQYLKHGAKDGEAFVAGIKNWDDTPAVRNAEIAYKAALRKEADTVVVTKGVADAPIVSNTPIGKLLFQFTGFLFGAHQRVLLRGLQQADAGAALGLTMMIAAGSLVAAIKQMEIEKSAELTGLPLYGSPLAEWDNAKLLYEGVDRSGILGLMGDFNNRFEKMGGYGLTRALGVEEPARYTNRSKSSVLLGPGAGKMESLLTVGIAPFDNKPLTDQEIRAARGLIPFQNITGIRHIFDEIQGEAVGE